MDEGDTFAWEDGPISVWPAFDSSERLVMNWRYAHGTIGAASDWSLGRYYAAVDLVEADVPERLREWMHRPEAVRAFLQHRPDNFIGWTRVPGNADFNELLAEVFRPMEPG